MSTPLHSRQAVGLRLVGLAPAAVYLLPRSRPRIPALARLAKYFVSLDSDIPQPSIVRRLTQSVDWGTGVQAFVVS